LAIDQDVHVYSLGEANVSIEEKAIASTERSYGDIIAKKYIIRSKTGMEGLKVELKKHNLFQNLEIQKVVFPFGFRKTHNIEVKLNQINALSSDCGKKSILVTQFNWYATRYYRAPWHLKSLPSSNAGCERNLFVLTLIDAHLYPRSFREAGTFANLAVESLNNIEKLRS